jgi:uncharacterized phage protein gp47/JayE
MPFGLTSLGFNKKQLTDLKTELEQAFRDAFGAGIKTTPDTQFGKIIGIVSDRYDEIWSLAEAIYDAQYPNSASGVALARVGELTGVSPNPATKSTVVVYLTGTDTTLIPLGSIVATQDAGDQFETLADITLSGSNLPVAGITRSGSTVSANIVGHGKVVGEWIFINNAVETEYNGLHQVTVVVDVDNLEYQISTTPSTPATGTIDMDPATSGNAEAVNSGPVQALAGTLNQIVTPTPGWTRVENAADATKGTDAETDAAFRTRRLAALKGSGSATLEAIRGAMLSLTGVTQAIVFENVTDFVDGNGRPAHSFEALVQGGVDQDILDELFAKRSAGIETFGTTSGTVTDSQGNNHTLNFSRPSSVNIWLELDLTVDANYPADGDTQVQTRVLAFGAALEIGEDVIVFPSLISSFSDVPGILDVAVRIGTAASPTLDDNIVIGPTQLADFDSARITIAQI